MNVRIEFTQLTKAYLLSAERSWPQVPRVGDIVDLTQTLETSPVADADTLPGGVVISVRWWSDGSATVSLAPRVGSGKP